MQNNTKIRQQAILDIIQSGPVSNQEELAQRLKEAGIETTQATLSRDLRALKISKVPGEGYVTATPRSQSVATDLSSGILRIQFSGQLCVVKTLPDTILLILREGAAPDTVLNALTPLFPEIKNRLVI